MTDTDFHPRRTELAMALAKAGADLLDFMRGAAGTLVEIPGTKQYVAAGNIAAIRAQLDTVEPQRRMRHGDRPELPLYFGAETGQPRRWAALITSTGHGVLQEYGSKFEHAQPGQEVLEVMEILPGAPATANKPAGEGELRAASFDSYSTEDQAFYKFWYGHMQDDLMQPPLADISHSTARYIWDAASRQVANKAEVEPVGVIVADDPVHGWHMHALKPWNEIGAGTKLYATPPATTGASTAQGEELAEEILSLHRQLAAEKLRANQGWERADAKSRECLDLRERMAGAAPASTVLTDERIVELMAPELHKGDGGYLVDLFPAGVVAAGRAIEREIAAQAGQVAVPKHWQLVPKDLTDEMYAVVKEVAPRWNAASVWANLLDAAPSPAKESK